MAETDIGMGKAGRRAYALSDIALLPSRRTRDSDLVDLSWQIDAYDFSIPIMASAMDSVTSPETAIQMSELGGVGVLDLEGLWTRHGDAGELLEEIAGLDGATATARLTELYQADLDHDLIKQRISELQEEGNYAAGAVSPKRVASLEKVLLSAGLDLLVIRGSIISAEHVSAKADTLNLKEFVRQLETPRDRRWLCQLPSSFALNEDRSSWGSCRSGKWQDLNQRGRHGYRRGNGYSHC